MKALFGLLFALVLGIPGGEALAQITDLNSAINKAGRQRMLSQRMAKAYFQIGQQVEVDLITDHDLHRLGKAALASKLALTGSVLDLFDHGSTLQELSGAVMRLPIWGVLANSGAARRSPSSIASRR